MNITVTLDNYKTVLPKKKWGMYLQYCNTPTYTGQNGEMNYNKDTEVLSPISYEAAEAMGIKFNSCSTLDLYH